jgi:hypothetical protein
MPQIYIPGDYVKFVPSMAPENYSKLVFELSVVQSLDMSYTMVHCVIYTEEPYVLLNNQLFNYFTLKTPDALLRHLGYAYGTMHTIAAPKDETKVIIHDPTTYLLLTDQMPVPTNTTRYIIKEVKKRFIKRVGAISISYGDSKNQYSVEKFRRTGIGLMKNVTKSQRLMWHSISGFAEKQTKLRKELGLWQQ